MTKRPTKPATHKDDPVLTPGAVGRIIGVSAQTVRRWIRDKMFRHEDVVRKPSGLFAIRLSAVERVLSGMSITMDPSRVQEESRLLAEAEAASAKTAAAFKRHKEEQAAKAAAT